MKNYKFFSVLSIFFLFSCMEVKNEESETLESVAPLIVAENPIILPVSQEIFWEKLLTHCGKVYSGVLEEVPSHVDFENERLEMHVMYCDENTIKIPFHVGEDRSRTWILTKTEKGILLKHDHRLEDGTEDEITMYGGHTANAGTENEQFFPADQETVDLIPEARANLWWITIDDTLFSYNLKRVTTSSFFRVVFDLRKPTENLD